MRDELGPATRALLDAAREGMSPSAAAIHRVRGKVGAAAGVTSGVAAMSLAAKLGIVSVVAALAIGAVIVTQRGDDAPPPRAPIMTAPAPQAAPAPPAPATIVTPPARATPAAPIASDDIDADKIEIESPGARPPKPSPRPTPVSTPAAPGNGPRVGEVQPAPPPPPPRKHGDLAREVALIDDAMAAFKRGDYTAALTAVHQHATETGGDGQLAEDAAAIEIEALCRSHHSVYTKLQAFDARWPSSAQRSRLTNNCP